MEKQTELIQSVQFLRLTIPRMKNLNIPITPENYAVWYEYSSGRTLELNRAIDDLLNSGAEFTDEVNRELYDTYISDRIHSSLLGSIQSDTESLLIKLLHELESMQDGTERFSKVLEDSAITLENNPTPEAAIVTSLVSALVKELGEVKKSNVTMEQSLRTMTDEVIGLRQEMEKLQGVAMTDALTGIMNRRAFDESMEDLVVNSPKKETTFCLLLADIDHFKKFNDTHGHSAGDRVLVYVATLLKKNIKGEDIAARYGGEEFAVILPDTKFADAMTVANHLCDKVSCKVLTSGDVEKVTLGKITISIGVAEFKYGEDQKSLIERADKALYAAKNRGRNQVVGEDTID